jgi:hypothetical protein
VCVCVCVCVFCCVCVSLGLSEFSLCAESVSMCERVSFVLCVCVCVCLGRYVLFYVSGYVCVFLLYACEQSRECEKERKKESGKKRERDRGNSSR